MAGIDTAKELRVVALVCYIIGMFTFVIHVPSIAISLHMVRVGHIVKKKDEVLAFGILELIAWVFVCAFGWYYQYLVCYDYDTYGNYYPYYCLTWLGWIAIVVWWVFGIAFGIPRVVCLMFFNCTIINN